MKNPPQNQYFPANAERMDVHCLESGCIGKYIEAIKIIAWETTFPLDLNISVKVSFDVKQLQLELQQQQKLKQEQHS